uniref:non-specific protein-tyrosine kinase n=1 Tax=Bursaphelenchus xylophilus TaxID=6326 RepID=A0A1I7RKU2_BURXY
MVQIEQSLHEAFIATDLISFEQKLAVEKQLTRISHFDVVTDDELKSYGLSAPAIRRLRNELDRRKKAAKKIFGSKQKTVKTIEIVPEPTTTPQPVQSTSSSPSLINKDELKIMQKLGEGTFASVRYGLWERPDGKRECAIKVLHQMCEAGLEDLFSEVGNMQKLKHENVVQLYGIVLGEQTMMVLEFCDGGSLLNRLRSERKPVLEVSTLLNYAVQIVSGMAYLESKRVVHRDLAARNILLTKNDEIIKICDFGLTRSLDENARFYEMSAQKKVPFAWCPPESLRFRQFSHKSDCWAFGVTLWELYTYGEEPWAGFRAADVLRITEEGQRLRKPEKALSEIYDIMKMCWEREPEKRPKFSHLRNILNEIRFITTEAKEDFVSGDSECMEVNRGDHIIIIVEHGPNEWFGQNLRSKKFGRFPRSLVSVKANKPNHPLPQSSTPPMPISFTATPSATYNSNISKPVPGSMIHTGHGDIDQNRCWGQIDKIDDIYLKNPVVKPLYNESTRQRGVSFIESITSLRENIGEIQGVTVNNVMPGGGGNVVRPVETPHFDPLKAWDMDPQVVNELMKPKEAPNAVRVRSNTHDRTDPERRRTTNITEDLVRPIKQEIDRNLTHEKPRSSTPQGTQKYNNGIAIPRPKPGHSFSQSPSNSITTNFPTKFDEPTVSQTATHLPNTTQFSSSLQSYQSPFQIDRSEPDPFVVDSSIKSLTLREPLNFQNGNQFGQPEWRQSVPTGFGGSVNGLNQMKTESARTAKEFTPLDHSILALLDPLVAKKTAIQGHDQKSNGHSVSEAKCQPKVHKQRSADVNPEKTVLSGTAVRPRPSSSVSRTVVTTNNLTQRPSSTNTTSQQFVQAKQAVQATVQAQSTNPRAQFQINSTPNQPIPTSLTNGRPVGAVATVLASVPKLHSIPNEPEIAFPRPSTNGNQNSVAQNTVTQRPNSGHLTVNSVASEFQKKNSVPVGPSSSFLSDTNTSGYGTTRSTTSFDSSYGSLNSSSVSLLPPPSELLLKGKKSSVAGSSKTPTVTQVFSLNHSNSSFQPKPPIQIVPQPQPIPFLTPTPFVYSQRPAQQQIQSGPSIDLHDLDIDRMISDVKKGADFASTDQCTKALRANEYEVPRAIQHLKLEKFMELGLSPTKEAAQTLLHKHNWDLNAAACSLVK